MAPLVLGGWRFLKYQGTGHFQDFRGIHPPGWGWGLKSSVGRGGGGYLGRTYC